MRYAVVANALLLLGGSTASGGDESVARLADEVRGKGWLAFSARSEAGDWDLFVCRPDGSALRNITRTPDVHEIAPQFSRDGAQLLYRRIPLTETVDGNHYGGQGELVLARGDGSDSRALGANGQYPWASWSPDGLQLACLDIRGVFFVELASGKEVRRLDRHGFFQQMTWSPDGKWLCGVANSFGTAWAVARMEVGTGVIGAVSRVDCCTPDWFPDSRHVIFSNRPVGQRSNQGQGWTQLWMADIEGTRPRLVYGEDGRHVYGGHVSPDGQYVLLTGNAQEDGDPGDAGAPMGLVRLSDTPIIGGTSPELRALHPSANTGPILVLPSGFEPWWTLAELPGGVADERGDSVAAAAGDTEIVRSTRDDNADAIATLAVEVRHKGWIAFSRPTDRGDWDLFAMRPDGSGLRRLTDTPDYNEVGVRFAPGGKRMLFYRTPRDEPIDNNSYGTHELVVADADGGNVVSFGTEYAWASWGPNDQHVAHLRPDGIRISDLAGGSILRRLPRQGIVQHLTWSPDGQWLVGTANGLGPYWNIGRVSARTGEINAASETDRYNCTPDWMPDGQHIIYARGIIPESGGWAELWMASADGRRHELLYSERGRHIYGGCAAPDGDYFIFTRSVDDLGGDENRRTRMALIRRADTPIRGDAADTGGRGRVLGRRGPVLDLSWGFEPHWTYAELGP